MSWQIKFYNESVKTEIDKLPRGSKAKFVAIAERLCEYGPSVQRLPHMRHLQNGLWEIRAIAADGSARIFYCWLNGEEYVLLHSFLKKSNQTPKKELDKALRRMKEVQNGR